MGLDGVELVIAIEERFGLEIPDADVYKLTTPRKLIDYLATRLNAGSAAPSSCLSQHAFYKVRNGIISLTGIPKSEVHPSTPLEKVLPEKERRTLWRQLQHDFSVKSWPPLVRPVWLTRLLWYFSALAFLLMFITLGLSLPVERAFWFSVAGCLTLLSVSFFATTSVATRFQPADYTVGALSLLVMALSSQIGEPSERVWSSEEIAAITRAIIMDQLGITSFHDDDRFVEDLGVD